MTLALLESIIFNRLTGPQSSPLTPATTIRSLRVTSLGIHSAVIADMRARGIVELRTRRNGPEWHTLQDVMNYFPEAMPTPKETDNP